MSKERIKTWVTPCCRSRDFSLLYIQHTDIPTTSILCDRCNALHELSDLITLDGKSVTKVEVDHIWAEQISNVRFPDETDYTFTLHHCPDCDDTLEMRGEDYWCPSCELPVEVAQVGIGKVDVEEFVARFKVWNATELVRGLERLGLIDELLYAMFSRRMNPYLIIDTLKETGHLHDLINSLVFKEYVDIPEDARNCYAVGEPDVNDEALAGQWAR
jgi:hypothetical protein